MGLFSQEQLDKVPVDYFKGATNFERGAYNKVRDITVGLQQSIIDLGVKAGLTPEESAKRLKERINAQSGRFSYDDRLLGGAGEFITEMAAVAPAATIGWFSSGSKVSQIYKQGIFGFVWDYFTRPEEEGKTRTQAATEAGAISAGATAALGTVGRIIEKVTNFDFKDNIDAVKKAATTLNVDPKLVGDFTGRDATRAAEALNNLRGGSVGAKLKENAKQLATATNLLEGKATGGAKYTGEAGKNIVKAVQSGLKSNINEGTKLYNVVDGLAEQSKRADIEPTNVRNTVDSILQEYPDLFPILERPALKTKLEALSSGASQQVVARPAGLIVGETGTPIIQEVTEPIKFTFSELRKNREAVSDALIAARKANKFGSRETNKLQELLDSFDADLDKWAELNVDNKKLYSAYQDARNYWRGNVIPFQDADLAVALIRDPASGELKTDVATIASKLVNADIQGQEGAKRAVRLLSNILPDSVKTDVAAKVFQDARVRATNEVGEFDPNAFIKFVKDRKQNLSPFLKDNIDELVNKYEFLSKGLTRDQARLTAALDTVPEQVGRVGVGAVAGGPVGAAIGAVPVNRVLEQIQRSIFETGAGRKILLSAQTLDDMRPIWTSATQSIIGQGKTDEFGGFAMPEMDAFEGFVLPE